MATSGTMTLTAMEFLRRFVQHILPRGFVRIRQSGFLANTCRTARVASRGPCSPPPHRRRRCPTRRVDHDEHDDPRTWACPRAAPR